jgi:hypothetical protein
MTMGMTLQLVGEIASLENTDYRRACHDYLRTFTLQRQIDTKPTDGHDGDRMM